MNNQQSTTVKQTWAFQFGVKEAQAGNESGMMFIDPRQQAEYEAGHASVTQPKPETAPVEPVVKIVVPQYKRNTGKELVRRTDSNVDAIFAAAERYWQKIDRMMAADPSGEMLWAS